MPDIFDSDPGRARPYGFATLCALLIGCSTLLCLQGYMSEFPLNMDTLINIDEAVAFLDEGTLPDQGGIASTGGYNPPGMSWLYLPGLRTANVYLYQPTGAAICHVLTMVGLFWLALRTCDRRTAICILAFYGFSTTALQFGSSLWPRAFPLFFVWMTLALVIWAQTKNAWAFGAAVFFYATGCYLFLEFLPAGAAFVCVFASARTRLNISPLIFAAIAAAVVWAPYLAFESQRDFFDVRKQLLSGSSAGYVAADFERYRDELRSWNPETERLDAFAIEPPPKTGAAKKLFFRAYYFVNNLGGRCVLNAKAGGFFLFGLVLCAALGWIVTRSPVAKIAGWNTFRRLLGAGGLLAGIVCNPILAGVVFGRALEWDEFVKVLYVEIALLTLGFLIFPNRPAKAVLGWIKTIWGESPGDVSPDAVGRDALWWCYLPSLLCVSLAAVFLKYTWWLWGVECVVLAIAVSYRPRRAGVSSRNCMILEVAVAALLFWNSTAVEKIGDCYAHGFAGQSPEWVRMLDRLGEELRDSGRVSAAIGYHQFFNGYELLNSEFDERYKIGAQYDLYFLHRYGFRNSTRAARGYSADDEYRIVQTKPPPSKPHAFPMTDAENFLLVEEHDDMQLWKRRTAPQ